MMKANKHSYNGKATVATTATATATTTVAASEWQQSNKSVCVRSGKWQIEFKRVCGVVWSSVEWSGERRAANTVYVMNGVKVCVCWRIEALHSNYTPNKTTTWNNVYYTRFCPARFRCVIRYSHQIQCNNQLKIVALSRVWISCGRFSIFLPFHHLSFPCAAHRICRCLCEFVLNF